jgi:hypothetical protein
VSKRSKAKLTQAGVMSAIRRSRGGEKVDLFQCTRPCQFCPYRTDTPVQIWAKEEFETVLEKDADELGASFLCHKQNGSICVGFVMEQLQRDMPSLILRFDIARNDVPPEYFDKLNSPAPIYASVREMVRANYPELLEQEVNGVAQQRGDGETNRVHRRGRKRPSRSS